MIKSNHGKIYYFEVQNEKEAITMCGLVFANPIFARNNIKVDYRWDAESDKVFITPMKKKEHCYYEYMSLGELRGETYAAWEWLKRKYYALKRKEGL